MGRLEDMRRRRRRRLGLQIAAAAGVLALVAAGVSIYEVMAVSSSGAAAHGPRPPGRLAGGRGGAASGQDQTVQATTTATPYGIQSSWVVAENDRPGTTAWQIVGTPPGQIAGFADRTSAHQGQSVGLYVTTDAATFRVKAYRMGWYHGAGARLVWTSAPVQGVTQPSCPVQATTHMVACDNWAQSLTVNIGPAFVQGDYLFELVGSGGQASYVPLTVTDPASRAAYLVENDIYTWQAWNDYGGYDFYAGVGSCPSDVYPICSRARVVSFDRPYHYGQGGGDFLGNEYPLVRFAEQHGLDVTYETSADLEQDPASILRHRALLSLGHDECWSYHERLAAQAAEGAGVNMIFFGASPVLRHVRMESSPLGADRQEVDYRDSAADPLDATGPAREVTGNTWSDPPADWTEVPFTGAQYTGYVRPGDTPVPYVVHDGGSWLFTGTGLTTGSKIPGLLVSDFDQVQPGLSPANVQILAHSPMPLNEVQTNVRDPASDTSYYTDPQSGAGVFDTGTVTWIPDLSSSPLVNKMTGNLLALFGTGPTGKIQPSVPNWQSVYGA